MSTPSAKIQEDLPRKERRIPLGFAFHTNLSLNLFAAAAGAALVLALGTISAQSFKAARANPAQSLKNE